jgi:hypothetical protein
MQQRGLVTEQMVDHLLALSLEENHPTPPTTGRSCTAQCRIGNSVLAEDVLAYLEGETKYDDVLDYDRALVETYEDRLIVYAAHHPERLAALGITTAVFRLRTFTGPVGWSDAALVVDPDLAQRHAKEQHGGTPDPICKWCLDLAEAKARRTAVK